MTYAVYTTKEFDVQFGKLQDSDNLIVQKIFTQVKENPYVGDAIRYRFFREKRIREKRIYYLVYEDLKIVLFISIGNKKIQQATINKAISFFSEFREYAKSL